MMRAQGPVDQLLRLNLLFYMAEVGLLFSSISKFVLFGFRFGIIGFALVVIVNPFLWFALRAILGQQVRLATNARRVLRTMDTAATMPLIPGPGGSDRLLSTDALQQSAAQGLESLLANLPWLPCHEWLSDNRTRNLLMRARVLSPCGDDRD